MAEQSQGCRAPTPVSIAPTASTPGRRNHQRANRRQRRGCLRAADGSHPGRSPSPPPSTPPEQNKKKIKRKWETEQPSPQTPFLLLRYPPKGCGLAEAGPSHGGAPIAARQGSKHSPGLSLAPAGKYPFPCESFNKSLLFSSLLRFFFEVFQGFSHLNLFPFPPVSGKNKKNKKQKTHHAAHWGGGTTSKTQRFATGSTSTSFSLLDETLNFSQ